MTVKRFFESIFKPHREDIERIVAAFPVGLADDVRAVSAILPFDRPEVIGLDGKIYSVDFFVADYKPQIVQLQGEELRIPYRIYFQEPEFSKVESLSDLQCIILHCLYLRHHDGHVRQKHLENLLGKTEYFICPFAVQLLGEYVIELLEVLEHVITQDVIANYADFLAANEFYWKQTQSRMTSYWDAYYRYRFPKLPQYIGQHLVDKLNAARRTNDRSRANYRRMEQTPTVGV